MCNKQAEDQANPNPGIDGVNAIQVLSLIDGLCTVLQVVGPWRMEPINETDKNLIQQPAFLRASDNIYSEGAEESYEKSVQSQG